MYNCVVRNKWSAGFFSFSTSSSFRYKKYMVFLQTYQNISFVLRKNRRILQSASILQTEISDILKQSTLWRPNYTC